MSSSELVRFSITVPEDMLRAFDALISRSSTACNRSEAVRDLIRRSLVNEQLSAPGTHIFGSLTMIYDHHASDLDYRLNEVQHDFTHEIISTMHVHIDHHNCMEILALNGTSERIHELASRLLALKGVKHGELSCTATHESIDL